MALSGPFSLTCLRKCKHVPGWKSIWDGVLEGVSKPLCTMASAPSSLQNPSPQYQMSAHLSRAAASGKTGYTLTLCLTGVCTNTALVLVFELEV